MTNWLPLFLFVVLFGLSMDYHVFIVSRIRELYDRGMSNDEAVRQGISTTGGTVTSAAIVMVGVFAVFVTLTFIDFKEMGFALAAAVLIDATIIRGVLLPASMKLLGDWNWYLPRWLEWLPRVGGEDTARPSSPPPPKSPATRRGRPRRRCSGGASRVAERRPYHSTRAGAVPFPARPRELRGLLNASLPPLSVANAKRALYLGADTNLQAAFEIENMMWTEVMQSDDGQLALKTFLAVDPDSRRDWFESETRRTTRPAPAIERPLATSDERLAGRDRDGVKSSL